MVPNKNIKVFLLADSSFLSLLLCGFPSFLCVCQLVSRPRMPSLPAAIDSSVCRVMKQPDHLARALLLFMFPKCLALFTKLSSPVCLESLINPAGLCREKVPLLSTAQSSLFYFCIYGCVCESPTSCQCLPCPLGFATLLSPSSQSFLHQWIPVVQRQSFFLIRPCVSLTILISAYFHYADEGGPVKRRTLCMRGCMLLLCTTLFGTLAALQTRHPLRHTLPHCSLSHFPLQRTHA